MVRTTAVPPRRLRWLHGELAGWERDGLVEAGAAERIRARYTTSRRASLTRVFAGLGAAFVAVGIIWLVAANLDRLGPPVRFAAVLLLWLALVVAAEVVTARTARPTVARDATDDGARAEAGRGDGDVVAAGVGALRLLAAAAAGAVVFQAAQSLQVPAYTSALLGWWALGALAYAYAVLGLAPLALGVALGAGWAVWVAVEGAEGVADGVAAVLATAVLATAVAALHTARRPGAGDHARTDDPVDDRAARLAGVWRLVAALLVLGGLFVAALPLGGDDRPAAPRRLVMLAVVAVVLAATAAVLGGLAERLELALVVATAVAAGALLAWRPEGDLADASPALTGRAALSVLVYLAVAAGYALLGARTDAAGLTWLATAALVLFTTVQSAAVFAPIITGAALFLVVGLVLLAVGLGADRARRLLLRRSAVQGGAS